MPKTQFKSWSSDEHRRFLEALEAYGTSKNKQSDMVADSDWQQMALHVGTRSDADVKLHASSYFLQLQLLQKSVHVSTSTNEFESETTWTLEEDKKLEFLLAKSMLKSVEKKSVYVQRKRPDWRRISKEFPEKSRADLRKRYKYLLSDLEQIAKGKQIFVNYLPLHQDKTSLFPPGTISPSNVSNGVKKRKKA